jgi:hypothetical protein
VPFVRDCFIQATVQNAYIFETREHAESETNWDREAKGGHARLVAVDNAPSDPGSCSKPRLPTTKHLLPSSPFELNSSMPKVFEFFFPKCLLFS